MINIPKSLSKLHRIIPEKALGSWIYSDKNKYLDLTSGIGTLSTGHSHPKIVETVNKQVNKFVHIPQQIFLTHQPQIDLTNKIHKFTPKHLDTIFYVNSGSEATDNAIKLARLYTQKNNIISIRKGFHGRTLGALSVTSSNINCKFKMQPLLPCTFFCDYPNIRSFNNVLNYYSPPEETACVILEPVMGEGGIYSLDKEFLQYVQNICNDHNILLIVDEVQCGIGRTGSWWNFTQKDISPDMITFAKGIASGFPLAGIISNNKVMDVGTNMLGGTYGGNALSSAVASTVIDIINEEKLIENSISMGTYLHNELKNIKCIKEIRQYGLMIALEFNFNDPNKTRLILDKLREKKILTLLCGNKGQFLRLLPPLNISKNELDIFLNSLNDILKDFN